MIIFFYIVRIEMCMDLMKKPSFIGHLLQGILILIFILFFIYHRGNFKKMSVYEKSVLMLLFILVIGLHSLSHLGLEVIYKFNPLE